MNSDNCFIFPGRFQPFHNDHHTIVQVFLRDFPRATLCLAIVFDLTCDGNPTDDFGIQSAEHFLPERNPWTPWQRLLMIEAYIRSQSSSRLVTTLIPRPSRMHTWQTIDSMFGGKRTWIVPSCGEEWDEKKATFFAEMGDKVLRVSALSQVDGFGIRTALMERRYETVKRSVPSAVWEFIEAHL